MKEKLNLNIESEVKEKARRLSIDVRLSISEIVELLLNNVSETEILKLYKKKNSK